MDSLTQGLLGGVTAQLGFRRRIGRDATWMATGAAMAPDLDIFIPRLLRLFGMPITDLTMHRFHRGLTHSLLMVPVMAAIVTLLWWVLRRRWHRRHGDAGRPSLWLLYACCFVAMLTHPLLDWCTSYGTQMLAPLTTARYAADCVAVVDIFYTPILMLTLLACLLARKLGARRQPGARRRATLIIGWAGFLLSVAYLAAGRVMHDRAVERTLALVPPGRRALRADAYPVLGTIFLFRGVVETEDAWLTARVRPFGGGEIRRARTPKQSDPWIEKALAHHDGKSFTWFAMGRVRPNHEKVDGKDVVHLYDMRYGLRTEGAESLWSLRIEFDAAGSIVEASRVHRYRRRDMGKAVGRLWREIWTP